jgi:hypothetical protein
VKPAARDRHQRGLGDIMPDANGNLLGIEEFHDGLRIRLVSAIDANMVAGFHQTRDSPAPWAAVNLRSDNEAWSFFTIRRRLPRGRDVPNAFALETPYILNGNPGLLAWVDGGMSMVTADDWRGSIVFTVDMLDGGCWFALNNQDRSRVLDVDHGRTDRYTHLLAFKWNGGDNQRWRAEIVK